MTKSIAELVSGTSGLSFNKANSEIEDDSASDIDVYESESCCVCKKVGTRCFEIQALHRACPMGRLTVAIWFICVIVSLKE